MALVDMRIFVGTRTYHIRYISVSGDVAFFANLNENRILHFGTTHESTNYTIGWSSRYTLGISGYCNFLE